ncbi:MAG: Ig-like protein, partial [Planctomycetaceae bacterium]|nr:Ig-like protein [Planctomycetaceae bacterium]
MGYVRPTVREAFAMRAASLLVCLTLFPAWGLAADAPAPLLVQPTTATLYGHRSSEQLIVSDELTAGTFADVTLQATYESTFPSVALVTSSGLIVPRAHGTTEIIVRIGQRQGRVPVEVRDYDRPDRVDFNTDVIAALSKAGCNQGSCHGSPQGKNGFRLSLRGFDPELDFMTLTHEDFGRRTNSSSAGESLILKKGLGEVPHQGGRRFRTTDPEYQILRAWIDAGCQPSPVPPPPVANPKPGQPVPAPLPRLVKLEVLPGSRRVPASHPKQQLIARAHFSDGRIRDVTSLCVFSTNEKDAAVVSNSGLVEFNRTAEVSFLVRYLDRISSVRLSYLQLDPAFAFHSPPEVNAVDHHVFAKQRELLLLPAEVCKDDIFLRRVYLDVTGTLPTPEEAKKFLDAPDSQKRARLIDELLERDDYAEYWALKWADLMRGSDVTISRRGVHSFHRYLIQRFRDDRPFDEFARET